VPINAVEVRQVTLPLVTAFRTATGTERERHVVLVRVIAGDVEGWGECSALTAPTYTSEYAAGAADVLVHHLAPAVVGAELDASAVATALAHVKGHPMAKAAVEMAVLDAELRHEHRSLATRLGATRDRVPAGVAVGITPTIAELLEEVGSFVEAGYPRVKLKIQPGWDFEPVRAVRECFDASLLLQVDANGSYAAVDDALARLAPLDAFDLVLIEQPLADDDLTGHAELAKRIRTPICLDESITSVRSARDALERGACGVVSIKAGRVGGYLEAVRIHDVCVEAGVPVLCGGMLDTGLARAANLALAALPGFTIPGDLYASDRWFAEDLTDPFGLVGGSLRVPDGPGIGVTPRPDVLTEHTHAIEIVHS
jgi:o-succinylbenzoate synthase